MATELLPDALWSEIEPLLPAHEASPSIDGGRPRVSDRAALTGILFVLSYEGSQSLGQALVVPRQAAKPGRPGKSPFDHPTPGQQHKAALGFGELDHLQCDAVHLGGRRRLFPRIALIDIGQFNLPVRDFLHRLGQLPNLIPILGIGRGDVQRQQVSQGIDGHMDFRAALALGPVVARPRATGGRRLQCPAIHNRCRRIGCPAHLQAQKHPQIMHHRFETARLNPASRPLIDDFPRRQIMGKPSPRGTRAHQPAQRIEDFPKVVPALPGIERQQGQIRGDKGPFFIADISGVRFASFHSR